MWTLVGSGQKRFEQSSRPMKSVLPSKAEWIKDRVVKFDPKQSKVITKGGEEIDYEFLVVAMGLENDYKQVKVKTIGY